MKVFVFKKVGNILRATRAIDSFWLMISGAQNETRFTHAHQLATEDGFEAAGCLLRLQQKAQESVVVTGSCIITYIWGAIESSQPVAYQEQWQSGGKNSIEGPL